MSYRRRASEPERDTGPLPRLRGTLVLAHGLFGFDRIGIGRLGLSYFGGIEEHLRTSGSNVVVPRVPMIASIRERAAGLARAIEALRGPIHVIAHSMGGLDARHVATHLDHRRKVASITTLSTPHAGSPFADWSVERVGVDLGVLDWLQRLGIQAGGFEDLTTETCAHFNRETPDRPDVAYLSYGAALPRSRMPAFLRWSHRIIEQVEGENDGLVSVAASRWGRYEGTLDADHLELVGRTTVPGRKDRFDAIALYRDIVRKLAALDA